MGRKEARSLIAATTNRVHCGGVVRETAAAAIGVYEDTFPTGIHVQARRMEVAASQEEDRGVVAEARPHGIASSPWSLFARRQWNVR